MKPTAQELTDDKIRHNAEQEKLEKERKAIEDEFRMAVNQGCATPEMACDFSLKQKANYLDWSNFTANSQRNTEREHSC